MSSLGEAIDSWESRYASMQALLEGLPADALDRPVPANPGWTVRGLGVHIATADNFVLMAGKQLSRGKNFPPVPLPPFLTAKLANFANARTIKANRGAGPGEMVQLLNATHGKARSWVDGLSDGALQNSGTLPTAGRLTVAGLLVFMGDHYGEHGNALKEALS